MNSEANSNWTQKEEVSGEGYEEVYEEVYEDVEDVEYVYEYIYKENIWITYGAMLRRKLTVIFPSQRPAMFSCELHQQLPLMRLPLT